MGGERGRRERREGEERGGGERGRREGEERGGGGGGERGGSGRTYGEGRRGSGGNGGSPSAPPHLSPTSQYVLPLLPILKR